MDTGSSVNMSMAPKLAFFPLSRSGPELSKPVIHTQYKVLIYIFIYNIDIRTFNFISILFLVSLYIYN